MNSIAKKFSTALCERYNDIKFEEIVDAAEQILQFLSEINAGEEAVNYLTNYIYYRVNYEANGNERKISGLFSSAFDSIKSQDYDSKTVLKIFRATVYSIRNEAVPIANPGWLIADKEGIDWLGEVFEQEIDIFNI